MKIIFICGSLEPGNDGVGDYTRLLALEIERHEGCQAYILALNDRFVVKPAECKQIISGDEVNVLRLPADMKIEEKITLSQNWINKIDPDWISLQFVPFAFHSKGIPIQLFKLLSALKCLGKWHIMFHEIWVGIDKGAGTKKIIWGFLQQLAIKRIVRMLQPMVMHTQTKMYQAELARHGIHVEYLSLFSNIPVYQSKVLTLANRDFSSTRRCIHFIIFGSIHPEAPIQLFTEELSKFAAREQTKISLKIVGRTGVNQKHWEAVWKEKGFSVEILGEQSPELISKAFSSSTVGISTTPYQLAEKSGSIAAMQAHGLPVICVAKSWIPRVKTEIRIRDGLTEYRPGNLEVYLNQMSSKPRGKSVTAVAENFISSLTSK